MAQTTTADTGAVRELDAGETHLAHAAMCALRTDYHSEAQFVEHVDGVLRPGGYRLAGAFQPAGDQVVAVAGFRVGDSLAWGHHLYVDDLSTLPSARRQGHAGRLLDWLIKEARAHGCEQIHLDSNVGPERIDAHRLYFSHGFAIYSHHFARGV